jgi:hypothetical protein
MAGFPKEGKRGEFGHDPQRAGPVSLSLYVFQQQGPGPRKEAAISNVYPSGDSVDSHFIPSIGEKVKVVNRNGPSSLV